METTGDSLAFSRRLQKEAQRGLPLFDERGEAIIYVKTLTVLINGQPYAWSETEGLSPDAVLTLQPWIITLAGRYSRKARTLHLDFEDLIQAGNLGALKAARTYDPRHGRTFLSWATPRIKDELNALCRCPVSDSLDSGGPDGQAVDVEAEGDATGDTVALEAAQIVSRLPVKDKAVLTRYYGLNGHKPQPATAIGRTLGLSGARTGQIVSNALVRARLEMMRCQNQ